MNECAISVRGIGKRYALGQGKGYKTIRESLTRLLSCGSKEVSQPSSLWALRDITFDVRAGEVVGIIGRNGAGKSTLLKVFSRITAPTEGEVQLAGRVGSLLEVGTGFHAELSGRENIYLSGAILGMSRAEIRGKFDEIVQFAEVEQFLDTPVKRYSSGMYMRLAFAVAAHLEPEILIVDEVLAVGDTQFQRKCIGRMSEVARAGRTVLFVSHNMASILQLCTSCVWLADGRIHRIGKVDELVQAYADSSLRREVYRRTDQPVAHPTIVSARIQSPIDARLVFGDKLIVEADVTTSYDQTVALEIIIRDQFNHPVVFLPSGLRFGKEFSLIRGQVASIRCEIPSVPFAEGSYTVDLLLAKSGIVVIERLEGVLGFDIIKADPCGTGRIFTQATRQGSVHLPATFEVATNTH